MTDYPYTAYVEYGLPGETGSQRLELKPKGMTRTEEFYVDIFLENKPNGKIYRLSIHTKKPIRLERVVMEVDCSAGDFQRVFSNGFQSWSESREFGFDEEIPNLRGIAKGLMKPYGDYHFPQIQRGKGIIHSWTYSYLRHKDARKLSLWASLSERTGYTIFHYDSRKKILTIEKDCKGLELTHSYPALEITEVSGTDNEAFDAWLAWSDVRPPKVEPAVGWTSWYHYYTDINEKIILDNLRAFEDKELDISIFQIDDGYQAHVGDWLDINKQKFPKGMKALADAIHAKGMKAGLWLAPFVCEKKSKLYKEQPDWLLKDEKGQPVPAGYNPGWSGRFYALDVYNKDFRNYLSQVFKTVLYDWGFDMVKLDFLYAASLVPRKHTTRGQAMCDGMEFLRRACGNKIILGCGVPLGAAMGLVDYCRTGADIHLSWEHKALKFLRNRERVSTIIALRSTLGRWQLNGRAFLNDPDVFILRDKKNKLTATQQYTILTINAILGRLIFTSDFVGDYSAEQTAEYLSALRWMDSTVERVTQHPNHYEIRFSNKGQSYKAFANLWKTPARIRVGNDNVELEPFETIVFKD